MSVSRSGVLIALVAVALYAAVLTVRQRLNLVIIGVMSAVLLRAAIPGLLGTVTSTFRRISTDDSISGRTDDYAVIEGFFEQAPVFGQGLGTFRPDLYFFLDNQYLMSLVEGGIIGVLGILAFFVLAAVSARGAGFRATTAEMRSRARAVLSAIVAIAVSGTFFDLFSFAQVTVIAFVLAGVAGALWLDGVQNGRALPTPSERIALAAGRGSALRTRPHIGSRS